MAALTRSGLTILGPISPEFELILTPEALDFVLELERRFDDERRRLLNIRQLRQTQINGGLLPEFLPETESVRNGDWTIAPLPADLLDRRVEITGPIDRKTIINALNSGANLFMADFEDATSPTWNNLLQGQTNLYDAVRRVIRHNDPITGRDYTLNDRTAVLAVRPRGLHLEETRILMEDRPISAALFDFGLYFFHNAKELLARGSGPYFYLPKLESHFEARLWQEAFTTAELAFDLPHGTIKATVLIETITAAFEMDEILHELRNHSAGLNCGRWDYIFSFIKKFHNDPQAVLPDRNAVTMDTPFLDAYSKLAVKTCHRRNAPAIGGMSAYIPVKDDPDAHQAALARVRADKEREVINGHDGTWVAHPALVPIAREVFDRVLIGPNQIHRKCEDIHISAENLLKVPGGPKTESGLRNNISVAIGYMASWLSGVGCVPLFNLMEDTATAEIARAQIWQWLRWNVVLDDGQKVDAPFVERLIQEENAAWKHRAKEQPLQERINDAGELLRTLVFSQDFIEFLTLPASLRLVDA
ncbi:malate synthase A [Azospirillaceae bacterium]